MMVMLDIRETVKGFPVTLCEDHTVMITDFLLQGFRPESLLQSMLKGMTTRIRLIAKIMMMSVFIR